MGKQLIVQRRGRGTSTFRVKEFSFQPKLEFRNEDGTVKDIIHHPGHNAPLAEIALASTNEKIYLVATEGMQLGSVFRPVRLGDLTEGTIISSLETIPNSGPKLCRSPGSFATLVSKTEKSCLVLMPSKKTMKLDINCRAMSGIPAGEGRAEKPFMKAGTRWFQMSARNKPYPRTSAVSMNAVDHPFGGSGTGKHKPPVSHSAPPGRKVGSIAARRSGRKK